MEQRSLRLGDIVDDYCPRERRITNHAVVALVGDTIKQTRCSTCETEHEYKEGRAPRRRGAKGEGGNGHAPEPHLRAAAEAANAELIEPGGNHEVVDAGSGSAPAESPVQAESESEQPLVDEPLHDGWLAHRPLIRATLPRTQNEEPPARPIPEFTMHQRQGRGFGGRGFRHGHSGFGGNGNPNGGANGNNFDSGGQPDGNRASRPGRSRHRRRHRRPR
jgi:hypothetical protein